MNTTKADKIKAAALIDFRRGRGDQLPKSTRVMLTYDAMKLDPESWTDEWHRVIAED